MGEPASAQSVAPPQDQTPIIVTAQRRPEAPQDVPISLTALSGDQLDRAQATDTASLGKVVPSLVMMRTGAFTQPYLRGVGKRSNLGVENGVATYVDGVYLASGISALLDLRGIERVEVLNGPQGTLFGRNTTGGVIQLVTRDPSPGAAGEAEAGVGSYGYLRGDAYVTGGNDRLAGNLALSLSRNGGYGTNLYTGKTDQGEVRHSFVGRTKWLWKPVDTLKLTFAADYQDIDQDFTMLPAAGYDPIGEPRVQDFHDSDQDASNRYRFRYGGVSLKAEADLGTFTLTSISAARWMHAQYASDLDMGPHLLLSAAPLAVQDQVSQEFQLQSKGPSRFEWVAGLYYIHIDERLEPLKFDYGGAYSTRLGGRIQQFLFDVGKVSSYAAYGQATFDLGEKTRLTGGARYTIEDRSVRAQGEQLYDNPPSIRPIPGLPLLTEEPLRNTATFKELTWRASLDHDLSPTVMGYLSASRGFQSGGWNLQAPQSPPYRPEQLDAFEAGLKFLAPSRRVSLDAGVFYYDYSDLQVSAYTPLGSLTTNATSADIYGLELQVAAQLDAETGLQGGVQFLAARYNSFPNATCTNYDPNAAIPYAPELCDATGNRLPFAPKLKFSLGVNHRFSLGERGTILLTGNLAYNSGYFSEADNVVRQRAFATVDLSAEWQSPNGSTSIRLWAANLSDTHYPDSLVTFPTAGVLERPAAPRRFGISLGHSF